MPFWVYSCFLFFLLLQACNVQDPQRSGTRPESAASTTPLTALPMAAAQDTGALHRVADDQTAGQIKPRAYKYLDAGTGTEYQMNPGWRVIPRQARAPVAGQPLAKTAGLLQTWTDWSGRVETRIYECVSPTLAQHQSLGCQVEADFVLVGGGAYADYGSGTGALLWESRPLDVNLFTWVASSKDHKAPNPHRLYVYAIGMRLKDPNGAYVPRYKLTSQLVLKQVTSSPAVHWPTVTGLTTVIMGGGARTNWQCCGSLLTKVDPLVESRTATLQATAKDHGDAELTTITSYYIDAWSTRAEGVMDIPGFGALRLRTPMLAYGNLVNTGVASAYADVEEGWVLVCPGGSAEWTSGPGRLLFGIKPTGTYQGQVGVYSKDHRSPSGGYNSVRYVEAQLSQI